MVKVIIEVEERDRAYLMAIGHVLDARLEEIRENKGPIIYGYEHPTRFLVVNKTRTGTITAKLTGGEEIRRDEE